MYSIAFGFIVTNIIKYFDSWWLERYVCTLWPAGNKLIQLAGRRININYLSCTMRAEWFFIKIFHWKTIAHYCFFFFAGAWELFYSTVYTLLRLSITVIKVKLWNNMLKNKIKTENKRKTSFFLQISTHLLLVHAFGYLVVGFFYIFTW